MSFTFNPLWKLLIDKGMTKEDLRVALGLSPSTIAKMGKGEYIAMEVLERICDFLHCGLHDIVEYIPKEKESE